MPFTVTAIGHDAEPARICDWCGGVFVAFAAPNGSPTLANHEAKCPEKPPLRRVRDVASEERQRILDLAEGY